MPKVKKSKWDHLTVKHKHREVWLDKAMVKIRPLFKQADYTVPDNVRIGVGWPSRGGLSNKKRTIGQAWAADASADGTKEIIISVWLDDPVKVLGVLIHEVVHVTVGNEHGHKKPFVDCMKAVGLCGKPTSTDETPELVETLTQWLDTLGAYPHAKLDGSGKTKQSTRLLKLQCKCGCISRVSNKWIEEYGESWPCPCSGILKLAE